MNDEDKSRNPIDDIEVSLGTGTALKQIEEAMRPLQIFDNGSAAEQVRRSMDDVAKASAGLTDYLAGMQDLYPPQFLPQHLEPVPNPVYETNSRLDELNDSIIALVGLAKQQASFTQAINDSTQAALKYAIQSGEEAKVATKVARTSMRITFGALVVTVISLFVSVYLQQRSSAATDRYIREERILHEQELRVLKDISAGLAATTKTPPQSPITPLPSARAHHQIR